MEAVHSALAGHPLVTIDRGWPANAFSATFADPQSGAHANIDYERPPSLDELHDPEVAAWWSDHQDGDRRHTGLTLLVAATAAGPERRAFDAFVAWLCEPFGLTVSQAP
jgi:hypothetical protein